MGEGAGQGAGESRFRSSGRGTEVSGESRFVRREQPRPERRSAAYTSDLAKIGIEFEVEVSKPEQVTARSTAAHASSGSPPGQVVSASPVTPFRPRPQHSGSAERPAPSPQKFWQSAPKTFAPTPRAHPSSQPTSQPVKTMSLADLKQKEEAPRPKHTRPDVDIDSLRSALKGALEKTKKADTALNENNPV